MTAQPDGKLALVQALQPVRKKVGARWVTLDPTLRQNADGSWSPKVIVGGLRLSNGDSTAALATMYVDGTSLALTLLSPTTGLPLTVPKPTVVGPTATYAQILPGVDLVVTGDQFGSFTEVFVVHDAVAAATLVQHPLRWSTATVGLTLTVDAAGNIVGTNAFGTALVTAPAPTMWDSRTDSGQATTTDGDGVVVDADSGAPAASSAQGAGANARVAAVQVSLGSSDMTLTPDASLLTAADTVFPVYVDPGFTSAKKSVSSSSTAWTYVASNYASTSYWKSNELKVGYEGWDAPHFKARSFLLLSVPVSTLAGATIYSSDLQLDEVWSGSCTKTKVNMYRVGTISSSTTWNNQPGKYELIDNPSAAKGHDSGCTAGNVSFNFADEIKSMVAGKHTAVTVGLYGDESDKYSWKKFSPKVDTSGDYGTLTTLYNHPPAVPTAAMMSTSPATSCASTVTVGDAPIVLQLTPSDADHQSLGIAFHVFTPAGTFVWQSTGDDGQSTNSYVSSAYSSTTGHYTQGRVVVPQSVLDNFANGKPTEMMWQAQVWDGIAETSWGPNCHFIFDPTQPGAPDATLRTGETPTVGQTVHFDVTGTGATYQVQLNGKALAPVKADSAGNATVSVTPTRIQNVLAVTAVSIGGNVGVKPFTFPFNAAPAAVAADGDLNTDGIPDMAVVGTASGTPNTGLYAAIGTGTTGGFAGTTNIGTTGPELSSTGTSADFAGAQAVIGHFDGAQVQDVLAYFPTSLVRSDGASTAAGTGVILPGEADGTLVVPAGDDDPAIRFTADMITIPAIGMSTPPIWLANAGNVTAHSLPADGPAVTVPDLFGIAVNDAGIGVLEVIPTDGDTGTAGVYVPGEPLYAAVNSTTLLTPPGGGDWSTWRIASAQTANGPVLYLWRPGTAGVWRWSGLTYTAVDDTAVLTVGSSVKVSATLSIPASSTVQAVDVNADAAPDLRVVTNTGAATAYLSDSAGTSLTAQASQTLTW